MAPSRTDAFEQLYVPDRASWRAWLAAHHATAPGVWLIGYRKASGTPSVPYDDAVEEALCFGWIDSLVNKLDEVRSKQLFTPRKPKSGWSRTNKVRVERLLRDGLMAEAGLAAIRIAQENGAWSALDAVEDLIVPPDLAEALAANPVAAGHFTAFPPSSRKIILTWIASAKQPATRAKRIAETVRLAAENVRANHSRP